MANKKKKKPQVKNNTKKPIKNAVTQQRDPREASPKEILFFKIGMSVIGLAVIILAIIFIVQYYVNKEAEDPFTDYVQITVDELLLLTQYDEDLGQYGDPDTLKGNDKYADINALYQSNDYFYVYFYHSSVPNDEIVATVQDYTGVDNIPTLALLEDQPDDTYKAVFFFDLDHISNSSLFDNTDFDHLGLDSAAENMLLVFDYNSNEFTLTIDINEILSEFTNLQS